MMFLFDLSDRVILLKLESLLYPDVKKYCGFQLGRENMLDQGRSFCWHPCRPSPSTTKSFQSKLLQPLKQVCSQMAFPTSNGICHFFGELSSRVALATSGMGSDK